MFKFLSKSKTSINSITFPNFGWKLNREEKGLRQWTNDDQSLVLSYNFFDDRPDIPTINNLPELRDYYRTMLAEIKGGIIQVDQIDLGENQVIKTVFKIPRKSGGMVYLASLTIPFKTCSYVIKIQAIEGNTTGIRESVVAAKLLHEENLQAGDENWSSDPYEKGITEGTLMNRAEEVKYDSEFPVHPLSLSRKLIAEIELKLTFDTDIQKLKPFGKHS